MTVIVRMSVVPTISETKGKGRPPVTAVITVGRIIGARVAVIHIRRIGGGVRNDVDGRGRGIGHRRLSIDGRRRYVGRRRGWGIRGSRLLGDRLTDVLALIEHRMHDVVRDALVTQINQLRGSQRINRAGILNIFYNDIFANLGPGKLDDFLDPVGQLRRGDDLACGCSLHNCGGGRLGLSVGVQPEARGCVQPGK